MLYNHHRYLHPKTFLSPPIQAPHPLNSDSPSPALGTSPVLSVSLNKPLEGPSHTWNLTVFVFLYLVSFTKPNVFKVPPCSIYENFTLKDKFWSHSTSSISQASKFDTITIDHKEYLDFGLHLGSGISFHVKPPNQGEWPHSLLHTQPAPITTGPPVLPQAPRKWAHCKALQMRRKISNLLKVKELLEVWPTNLT